MSSPRPAAQPGLQAVLRRVAHGGESGIVAGLVFLLVDMAGATARGDPTVSPLYAIATVFNFADRPTATPENLSVGLITHACLAMLFGVVFALLVPLLPRTRLAELGEVGMLTVGGALYGLALYSFNYQVLGRTLFPWFTNPHGPNQLAALGIHVLYGLLLMPFFIGLVPPRRESGSAPQNAPQDE